MLNENKLKSGENRMKRRDWARMAATRIVLKKQRREAGIRSDLGKDIGLLLANDDAMQIFLHDEMMGRYVQAYDEETPVIDFMKWLIEYMVENQEEIAALIKLIISLF